MEAGFVLLSAYAEDLGCKAGDECVKCLLLRRDVRRKFCVGRTSPKLEERRRVSKVPRPNGRGASFPEGHFKEHHKGETDHGAHGREIAVPALLRLRDHFLHHDEDHGSGGESQRIRKK